MNGTLLDANVLIDVFDPSAASHAWSSEALMVAMSRGPVFINPVVYAELSVPFHEPSDLEMALGPDIERRDLPWAASFLAGKAFREYRRRGGVRTSPLPDFYVGAHAAVEQLDIITRDPRRVTSYFPRVQVIHPGSDRQLSPGGASRPQPAAPLRRRRTCRRWP